MLHIVNISYPHNIIVKGQTTETKTDNELKAGAQNGFQDWLNENYVDNDRITACLVHLDLPKVDWEPVTSVFESEYTYEQHVDMLEHFAGQTIKIIVGL